MSLKGKNDEAEQIILVYILSYSKKLMSFVQHNTFLHPAIQQPELHIADNTPFSQKMTQVDHKNKGMRYGKKGNKLVWLPGIDRDKLLQCTGPSDHVHHAPAWLQKGMTKDCIYKSKSLTEFL